MSRSVQLNLPPALVEKSSRTRETTHPDRRESAHPSAGEKASLTALLADAVSAVGCSEKEAAIAQGYDPKYWPRVKSGEKPAHLDRVARLPEQVQREFVKRYASELKMRVSDEDAQKQAVADLVTAAARVLAEIA